MKQRKLFGTDGIRGIANQEPMNAEMALRLGRAAAHVFRKDDRRHRFVIGKDTRRSGYLFENALVAGICSMGDEVLLVGPLPTPGISFITRSLRADAGIVISASHNPYEYNGIKFFDPLGFKLPDALEARMEELVFTSEIDAIRPTAEALGKAIRIDDAAGRYIEFVKNSIPRGMTFDHLKIVLDCANGAAYKVAPAAFRELGATVVVAGDEPDGVNINAACGSLYPESLAMLVKEHRADLGFAFDGDADRVIAVAENGDILDGDHILAIAALHLQQEGRLQKTCVVSTIMANLGLQVVLKEHDIILHQTAVGDRYVTETMNTTGSLLGGEQSGHIIFREFTPTGDGLISALQITAIVTRRREKLSRLAKVLRKVPQYIQNVKVGRRSRLEDIPDIVSAKDSIEQRLGERGRLVLRFSGTEPLIRIMVESLDEVNIEELTSGLIQSIKQHLGSTHA